MDVQLLSPSRITARHGVQVTDLAPRPVTRRRCTDPHHGRRRDLRHRCCRR